MTGLGPFGPGPGDGLAASWPDGHAPATGFGLTASAMRGGPDGPEDGGDTGPGLVVVDKVLSADLDVTALAA